MEVYQATIEDIDGIASLFNQYRVFYNQESDVEGARNFILDRFIHQDSIIFVAVEQGEFLGFTQLYPLYSSVSMKKLFLLNDLYVQSEARGKGLGRRLLESAKEYARKAGAKGITLQTENNNDTAQRLYEKNGYEKDSDYTYYNLLTP